MCPRHFFYNSHNTTCVELLFYTHILLLTLSNILIVILPISSDDKPFTIFFFCSDILSFSSYSASQYIQYYYNMSLLLTFKWAIFLQLHTTSYKTWIYILIFVVFFGKYFLSIQTLPHWFYLETIYAFSFPRVVL